MRLRVVLIWLAVLGCGSKAGVPSSPVDGGGQAGENASGEGGKSGAGGEGGGSGAGGEGGASGAGGEGGEGGDPTGGQPPCGLTQTGKSEPIFDQPTSRVRVYAASSFTVVDGAVLDGQRREIHTESARSGNCRLLTYDSPSFCDPTCENPAICVHGTCERFPEPVSAGVLSVQLGEESIEVEPSTLGTYYFATEAFGYDVVDSVSVSAPGDVAPGFELSASLSPAPVPTSDWHQLMQDRRPSEDVRLAWSNAVPTARLYLRMTTCVGTHGGISPVEIECEGPDVGELTLPGVYLDALYAGGWSHGECGVNELRRYDASQACWADAAVQLRAESSTGFFFHPNFDPEP